MPRPDAPSRRAIFVDRDGVLNVNRTDYVKNLAEFQELPDAYDAVRRLNAAGYEVVVVTNQSAVGRGLVSLETLDAIHERLHAGVEAAGGRLAAIYVCPHRPEDGCGCRKPAPGLLERALRELNLTREGSWMVGDAEGDVHAGRAAGLRTVFVSSSREPGAAAAFADLVTGSLREVADCLERADALAGRRPFAGRGMTR